MKGLSRGFTLVEMAVAVLVLGMVMAFSIPAFQSMSRTYRLKGATENIAVQLRLAREKAIATGVSQEMHFAENYPSGTPFDYHIHNSGVVGAMWELPRGVTYQSVTVVPRMLPDGRCNTSGMIILQDPTGARDTVSVQLSGLVLTK
jgi:prepilin-type N-terminal cleavage/methylation domain-containing protein